MKSFSGFSQSDEERSVIVRYKGPTHLLSEGDSVSSDFKVRRISEDVITIFNNKAKRREFVQYGLSNS